MRYVILCNLKKLRINECYYIPACLFHNGLVVKRVKEEEYMLGDLSKKWLIKCSRQDIIEEILTYGVQSETLHRTSN